MLMLQCHNDVYELKPGRNVVGNDDAHCHIVLLGKHMASVHATIDVSKDMREATIVPGPSAAVVHRNGAVIAAAPVRTRLVLGDAIAFGTGDDALIFKFDAMVTHSVGASIDALNRKKALLHELNHVLVAYLNDNFVSAQLLDSAKRSNQSFDIDSDDDDDVADTAEDESNENNPPDAAENTTHDRSFDTNEHATPLLPMHPHGVVQHCRKRRQVKPVSGVKPQILRGPEIASTHATIDLSAGGAIVTDLGSANGVYFNGVRITRPQMLVHGDVISFSEAGTPYKFDLAASPSVAKSIASSVRSSAPPPMFSMQASISRDTQEDPARPSHSLRQSKVFPSYQDTGATDAALLNIVERQLLRRRSSSSSAPASSLRTSMTKPGGVHLSPTHRDFLERQKLRLSQKIRDVNNIMLGATHIQDTYLAAKLKQVDHDGFGGGDSDDDELPETSEKQPVMAPPTSSMIPPPWTKPHAIVEASQDDDIDDDDELPEMVEKLPEFPADGADMSSAVDPTASPQQMTCQPSPPKPSRPPVSDSVRRLVDARIQTHRVKAYMHAWDLWRTAVRLRRQREKQQQKETAAKTIHRLVAAVRLRQTIAARVGARRTRRLRDTRLQRVLTLMTKQHWRLAVATWRTATREIWVHDRLAAHVAQRQWARGAERAAFQRWKDAWTRTTQRRAALGRLMRHGTHAARLRGFLQWQAWCLESEAKVALAKVLDEQTKHKMLVQTMTAQSQAEASAWSEQAKEMHEAVQTEAALKQEIAALKASAIVSTADVGVQTNGAKASSEARASLLSHTLLKTVVGEVKEKNLRAVIESLEDELQATQDREAKLHDEYKQLLDTMVRHSAQLDEAKQTIKQHQETMAAAEMAKDATEKEAGVARRAAADREAALQKRIDELDTAMTDVRRRDDLKKSMETKTQNETLEMMDEACKRAEEWKAKFGTVEAEMRKKEAEWFKLTLARESDGVKWSEKIDALEKELARARETDVKKGNAEWAEKIDALEKELAQARQADVKKGKVEAPLTSIDLDTHTKMLEAVERKLTIATKQLNAKREEERAMHETKVQQHAQFNSHVESFLEDLVSKYDLRLLRVGGELELLLAHGEKDRKVAQFRAASNLVGYVQEDKLTQYETLSKLQEELLQLQTLALTSPPTATTNYETPLSWTQNTQFLYDMLMQRIQRLHQLHESLAHQAATMGEGYDTKKLEFASFLVETMYTRQVDFAGRATSLLQQISHVQAGLHTAMSDQP
ncbi:Aste57867_20686 [Aphanomyces stellatus]|uniref:Aste57867_20686 protein n=1 Tax=Aphanomyces stellatus TaxID=120398 RepID=A0A485LG93_9STRA|nr:hypothetical protein As57867_020618 [Aphanomyces stellatus]VFT97366.1 Aste57867_20686 [Aphanomyces stellatus]